jgi:hypothetical protein
LIDKVHVLWAQWGLEPLHHGGRDDFTINDTPAGDGFWGR